MKRLVTISILLIAISMSQSVISQNSSSFDLRRTIKLSDEDTETQNIILNVTEKTSSISLAISCKVVLGNLKVEIYDPEGNIQGEFVVESQVKRKPNDKDDKFYRKETVEGQIEKIINKPINGDWVIKLIPLKTFAEIEINSRFITEN